MKIAVAISGGVDSAVSAYILKNQGNKIRGFYAILNDFYQDSLNMAKDLANKIDIPLEIIDLRADFKIITDYFIETYLLGQTPNPCPKCNKIIKAGRFFEKIKENFSDIQYLATGHYAQIKKDCNRYFIKKAFDKKKDQSYMLYQLSQDQLQALLFPLASYQKAEIKLIAKKIGLNITKESQDICFSQASYQKFILDNIEKIDYSGYIKDIKGNILGKHKGVFNFTVGQRKGLDLKRNGTSNDPLYVIKIDSKTKTVFVGSKQALFKKEFLVKSLNWQKIPITETCDLSVKTRYNSPEVKANIMPINEATVKVSFFEAQEAVSPGQACVFYQEDCLVGGGIIDY